MAVDKLVDSAQLDSDLTSIANAIRTKGGTSAQLAFPQDFITAINAISGGTGAISVVDTADSHGGTIRTITALDISDTTAVASDVASGKYFYTAAGVKTAGTGSGGGSTLITKTITANGTYNASSDNADGYSSVTVNVSGGGGATHHEIHLEFTDSTDEDIDVYYDDSLISTMITAYMPTTWTYGNKTVLVASLDNVTWYDKTYTWETVWDGNMSFNEEPGVDSFAYITELGNVAITENSVWRVTFGDEVKIHTAVYGPPYEGAGSVWHINSITDGTNGVYAMWNSYQAAWIIMDIYDMTNHTKYVKIERAVMS